jgi:uncharacterized protein
MRKTLAQALDWRDASLYARRGRSGRRESDMTPEERQMLGGLFQRVNAAAAAQRDGEAEAFINDAVRAAPHAPYVLAQTVLVQQQALEAAASRISQLEAPARDNAGQGEEQGSFLGNLGRTIFGGGAPSAPPRPSLDPQSYQRAPAPPPPQGYAPAQPPGYPSAPPQGYPPPPPNYPPQPGPWGQPQPSRGGGFLQNAASTAAGVAGGVALGNLLGGLFGGHGGGSLFGGGGVGGASVGGSGLTGNTPQVTEINNYYDDRPDTGSDAGFQQFDPGAPGVQDANFDNLDDSTFDGSDGSSFDDGGGYDDV